MSKLPHPLPEEFLWYTRHGLTLSLQDWPSARVQAFEEHIASCDSCAAALATEAETELLLAELADTPQRSPHQGLRRLVYVTAAALALVVAVGVRGSFAETPPSSHDTAEYVSLDAGVFAIDGDIPSNAPEP